MLGELEKRVGYLFLHLFMPLFWVSFQRLPECGLTDGRLLDSNEAGRRSAPNDPISESIGGNMEEEGRVAPG